MKSKSISKNAEIYLNLFFILFGGVVFGLSSGMRYYSEFGPGPGLLPLWTSGLIILFGIVNLIKTIKANKESMSFASILPKGSGLINLLVTLGALLFFIVIVNFVGFVISSVLMLFALFSRGYKWYWGLGLSILVTGIIYVVFVTLLSVPLPLNSFGF